MTPVVELTRLTGVTVVALKILPSPSYERTLPAESNALPCGAPRNVEIGTKVSPSAPMGMGAGNELGWYSLLFVASSPP